MTLNMCILRLNISSGVIYWGLSYTLAASPSAVGSGGADGGGGNTLSRAYETGLA